MEFYRHLVSHELKCFDNKLVSVYCLLENKKGGTLYFGNILVRVIFVDPSVYLCSACFLLDSEKVFGNVK